MPLIFSLHSHFRKMSWQFCSSLNTCISGQSHRTATQTKFAYRFLWHTCARFHYKMFRWGSLLLAIQKREQPVHGHLIATRTLIFVSPQGFWNLKAHTYHELLKHTQMSCLQKKWLSLQKNLNTCQSFSTSAFNEILY